MVSVNDLPTVNMEQSGDCKWRSKDESTFVGKEQQPLAERWHLQTGLHETTS